jgi:hypothetical protein
MTGIIEAGTVISLISGVLTIIDATFKIYDSAKDANGQPEAFRQVAAQLPLVEDILQRAGTKAKTLDESEQDILEPILKSCKTKAGRLHEIFKKVVRRDDDKWHDRYKKAFSTFGKGHQVECLMEGILKDIQLLLACDKLAETATDDEIKRLEEAIKELDEMEPSLQDEADSHFTHFGSGDLIGTTGNGTTYLNKGSGDMWNNTFGDGTTANFGSKK